MSTMLAPFVLDLLIACTLMLLAGWVGDVMARWIGIARHADPSAASVALNQRRGIDPKRLAVCEFCEMSGDWLFKLDHPERN
jgi:hypothetical protein